MSVKTKDKQALTDLKEVIIGNFDEGQAEEMSAAIVTTVGTAQIKLEELQEALKKRDRALKGVRDTFEYFSYMENKIDHPYRQLKDELESLRAQMDANSRNFEETTVGKVPPNSPLQKMFEEVERELKRMKDRVQEQHAEWNGFESADEMFSVWREEQQLWDAYKAQNNNSNIKKEQ